MEKIYIPININNKHWALSLVLVQLKIIRYYDSLGSPGHEYLEALLTYLSDESQAKRGFDITRSEWKLIPCTRDNTPQQNNIYDCGVFVVMMADFIADDIPLHHLKQEDIPDFRKKMCYAIVSGKLFYE
jgi:sentrin-specific protease 1